MPLDDADGQGAVPPARGGARALRRRRAARPRRPRRRRAAPRRRGGLRALGRPLRSAGCGGRAEGAAPGRELLPIAAQLQVHPPEERVCGDAAGTPPGAPRLRPDERLQRRAAQRRSLLRGGCGAHAAELGLALALPGLHLHALQERPRRPLLLRAPAPRLLPGRVRYDRRLRGSLDAPGGEAPGASHRSEDGGQRHAPAPHAGPA
mmetsp:Transcript_53391/g.159364  ORF Transcript_53391/g.159364 Transcript_53391/m.159364 type:complete len:206 (+) Transcript_53391:511-1128(+)